MKKFILFLVLFVLISCNRHIIKNIYERTYDETNVAYKDVYDHLYKYQIDSIPLDYWLTNELYDDTTTINQKTFVKMINSDSSYQFILNKYVYPTSLFYQFIIRYSGNKKYLQK